MFSLCPLPPDHVQPLLARVPAVVLLGATLRPNVSGMRIKPPCILTGMLGPDIYVPCTATLLAAFLNRKWMALASFSQKRPLSRYQGRSKAGVGAKVVKLEE